MRVLISPFADIVLPEDISSNLMRIFSDIFSSFETLFRLDIGDCLRLTCYAPPDKKMTFSHYTGFPDGIFCQNNKGAICVYGEFKVLKFEDLLILTGNLGSPSN